MSSTGDGFFAVVVVVGLSSAGGAFLVVVVAAAVAAAGAALATPVPLSFACSNFDWNGFGSLAGGSLPGLLLVDRVVVVSPAAAAAAAAAALVLARDCSGAGFEFDATLSAVAATGAFSLSSASTNGSSLAVVDVASGCFEPGAVRGTPRALAVVFLREGVLSSSPAMAAALCGCEDVLAS